MKETFQEENISSHFYKFSDISPIYNKYLDDSHNRPVLEYLSLEKINDLIKDLIDNQGKGTDFLLNILDNVVIKHSINLQNPMYMGHQVAPSLPLAVYLDLIISGLNQSLAVSRMSPVLSVLETELIKYLSLAIGYNDDAGGTITSGGSTSNLLGLLGAKEKLLNKTNIDNAYILCSKQSHYSIKKAAKILGFSSNNIIAIETNKNYQIDLNKTEDAIKELINNNKIPFAICANAGSTSTGSFDDLDKLADIASQHKLWLHIDAAHGGPLIFSEKLKHLLKGIEKADSISWDGHKMMYMPTSLGICLFKYEDDLRNCFKEAQAPYLYNNKDDRFDLSKLSIQCTRRGDALKLWGSLVALGTDFFANIYDHLYEVTQYFYENINQKQNFEAIHQPEFNIFCFRYLSANKNMSLPELNEINANIRDEVNNSGETMITMTMLNDIVALRTTIINPSTTTEHIDKLINIIENNSPD